MGETALKSGLMKTYIFVDVALAAARLVNELGGEVDQVIPELNSIEAILSNIKTIDELRGQTYKILSSALTFRDNQANSLHGNLIYQAKEYIDSHYSEPKLSLHEVAANANLSASYFCVVFSQEAGQTFKEYLTDVRIGKAKEGRSTRWAGYRLWR